MGGLEEGHVEGDGHDHVSDDHEEADFTRPPLGDETGERQLTDDEQSEVEQLAVEHGVSLEKARQLFDQAR